MVGENVGGGEASEVKVGAGGEEGEAGLGVGEAVFSGEDGGEAGAQLVEVEDIIGSVLELGGGEFGCTPVGGLLFFFEGLGEEVGDEVGQAMAVGVSAGKLGGELGAEYGRGYLANPVGQHGEVSTGKVENFLYLRVG